MTLINNLKSSRQLGQVAPTDTNVTTLYAPPDGIKGEVNLLIVANVTGSAATYSIFNDADGTGSASSNALYKTVSLAANTSLIVNLDPGIIVNGSDSSTIIVQSGTADALTFTIYGREVSET